MIYFIQAGDGGPIKIGYVTHVDQIKTWQEGSPVPLKILTTFEGGLEVEAYLHSKFSRLKQHGKWFKVSQEILDFIKNSSLPLDLLEDKPGSTHKMMSNKLNQMLLKIKYQNRVGVDWQDIARELGMSTERLHKLRNEGFYGGLPWEQIQRLAKLLNMRSWELVRLAEEGCLPDDVDN
jgi:hypothetical protein